MKNRMTPAYSLYKKGHPLQSILFLFVECVAAPVLRNLRRSLNVFYLIDQFLFVGCHRLRSWWGHGPFYATTYRHSIADFTPVKTTRRTLETFKAGQQQVLAIRPSKAMVANPHFPAGAGTSIRSGQVSLHKTGGVAAGEDSSSGSCSEAWGGGGGGVTGSGGGGGGETRFSPQPALEGVSWRPLW